MNDPEFDLEMPLSLAAFLVLGFFLPFFSLAGFAGYKALHPAVQWDMTTLFAAHFLVWLPFTLVFRALRESK